MESHGGRLAATVVDQSGGHDETGERGDGDEHAVVFGSDVGQEFARDPVVRDLVDGDQPLDARVFQIEDRVMVCHACVVEDDGGVAVGGFDGVAD